MAEARANEVVVVGAGLSGLSCAMELTKHNLRVTVLEEREVLGGRTSSWVEDGMPVESGLHKFLGIYRALPELLREAGVDPDDILFWVDEVAILIPGGPSGKFTLSPYHRPLNTAFDLVGNTDFLPTWEKAKLSAFAAAGMQKCVQDPLELDRISIADFARQFGLAEEVIYRLLFSLTQGALFLSADDFSAYAVFAPIVEGVKNLMTFRVGAFKGGMTDVMIEPIARSLSERGGRIRRHASVTELIVENGDVRGVRLKDGEDLRAGQVVLAVPLRAAQELLRPHFGGHPWFQNFFQLPSLSAATIQLELDDAVFPGDWTNFTPTALCCFAEQTHTTYPHVPGRFSVILYPPEEFLHMPPEQVLERTYEAAEQLGIALRGHVQRYRIVNHPHDFYAMRPGTEALRPEQQTPIRGLSLAGDYTKQPFVASMEGAVISGRKAAAAVQAR